MASTPNDRIRTRAQRVAARVSYDSLTEKTAKLLYANQGLQKIGVTLFFALVICVVCGVWDPPANYQLYTIPERNIVCNTPFRMHSPDLTNAERKSVRLKTLRYYVNNSSEIENYKGELLAGVQLLLEQPDVAHCGDLEFEFLKGFLSPSAPEDARTQAFEKLHAYFAEDAQLAKLRKTLDVVLEPYAKQGVLLKIVDVPMATSPAADADDDPKSAATTPSRSDVNEIVRIKVYDFGLSPDEARIENLSDVLFGNGYAVKAALKEQIDDLEIVHLLTNKIKSSIPETLTLDYYETQKAQDREEQEVESRYLSFNEGDPLVLAGHAIGLDELRILDHERQAQLANRTWKQRTLRFVAAYLLLAILMVGAFLLFHNRWIHLHSIKNVRNLVEYVVFMALMALFIGLAKLLQVHYQTLAASPDLVPILIFTELTALAATWEVALTFGTISAFVVAVSGAGGLDLFTVYVGVGMVVSIASQNVKTRTQLFAVATSASIAAFALSLLAAYVVNDYSNAIRESAIRGVLVFVAGFLTAGVLPIFERCFGILTPMRLLEYSNPSHPLLLELNRRAPATYSHSIQTAALAEPAAEAIGARSALIRVGAYFHDVGKMLQPEHFTENQKGYNIHEDLEPRMSALVIVAHTKDGVDLGKRYKLPKQVIDLVEQHHGTMLVSFFYNNACKAAQAKDPNAPPLDESPFRYPGPIPQTKEAAILMLSDAVESASRSLSDWSPRRVENLVRKLTEARIEDGQFNESGLTLGEIQTIEQSLVSTLLASHHTRVKYPSGKDASKEDAKDVKDAKDPKEAKDQSVGSNSGKIKSGESTIVGSSETSSIVRLPIGFEDAYQK